MKSMKKMLGVGLLIGSMLIAGCGNGDAKKPEGEGDAAKKEDVITVGVCHTGEPYVFSKDGELSGFEADMWKELTERTGLKVEFEYNDFASLFGMLDNGQIDTIAHFLGKTPERAEKYDFSDIYSTADLKVLIHNDSEEFDSVEDLHGKTIALNAGSAAATTVEKIDPDKKINFVMYEDIPGAAQDVHLKRVDGYYGNCIALAANVRKMNIDCKTNDLALFSTEVGYPFRKNDEESKNHIEKLNAAIKDMINDGTIKEISEKWLLVDTTATLRK